MSKKKSIKSYIPNILTASRIIFTPIIIMLGYFNKMNIVIILVTVAAITDFLDGRLARKWNIVSVFGAKLDAVADKIFAIGLIACLTRRFPILLIPFGFEIIIGITNLFYYYQTKITKSLWVGKAKTTLLFITVILGFVCCYTIHAKSILWGAIYATINLQIISLISYYFFYQEQLQTESPLLILNDSVSEDAEPTIMLDDLQNLIEELTEDN